MLKLGIYFSIAIIALNLNGSQARSFEGDNSKIPPNQIMVTMLTLLDEIAKQNKCNIVDELNKTQIEIQKNSEETQIALQNQQADIQKLMGSQLETQINLEKDQRALMETFKNTIPKNFTERLVKMEEHETSLQETLNKISFDFDKVRSVIHDQQDSVLAQLEVGINLEKDQKTQLETLTNTVLETSRKIPVDFEVRLSRMDDHQKAVGNQLETQINLAKDQKSQLEALNKSIPENFEERLAKMEEQQTSLQKTSKQIPEDFESRLETIEKNQKDILSKMETQQVKIMDTLKNQIFPEQIIALQNQQADIQKSMGSQLETQISLEKDQKALMETFKNIIPEHFTERLVKMEEQQTSLQETLNKISLEFDKARSVIHDQQDSVLAKLEVEINLEKDQNTQLETLKNTVLENSKKNPEDLEGRLDRMEKNQKDMQTKMETQQTALVGTLSEISTKVSWPKFELIGSRLFFIDRENKYTWEEAVSACRNMGGYLASIKDQKELDAMKKKLDKKLYWLGINDRTTQNNYISVASGKKAQFLKWKSGEPNHYTPEERCVELINGEMNDETCDRKKYMICQTNSDF